LISTSLPGTGLRPSFLLLALEKSLPRVQFALLRQLWKVFCLHHTGVLLHDNRILRQCDWGPDQAARRIWWKIRAIDPFTAPMPKISLNHPWAEAQDQNPLLQQALYLQDPQP
jgi:hypothetical protein